MYVIYHKKKNVLMFKWTNIYVYDLRLSYKVSFPDRLLMVIIIESNTVNIAF